MPDLINYHPHSRYTLHEKAPLYPFLDLIWRKPDGPFIDLKVDFPDPTNNYADGTAYLRVEDVIEMARVIGMATREDVEALRQENAELKAKLNQLPTKVEGYKDELHRITSDFVASIDSAVAMAVAYVEAKSDSEPDHSQGYATDGEQEPAAYQGHGPDHRDSSDSDEGTGNGVRTDHSVSSESDESAAESSDESVVSERSDELSSAVSNESDPLASFLGLGS